MGRTRQDVGRQGEDLAAAELERGGLHIIDRNWRCPAGEIDIIATDEGGEVVVFCEVKCRTGLGYGDPLEAITYAKVRRLRQLASQWLNDSGRSCRAVRLDAVGVVLLPGREPALTHVRGIGG